MNIKDQRLSTSFRHGFRPYFGQNDNSSPENESGFHKPFIVKYGYNPIIVLFLVVPF